MNKKIHPKYNLWVEVSCICWNKFTINSAVKWPIKIDSCPSCNSVYTWFKESKVIKWRMEKFLEKQKKIDSMKNKN